MCPAVERGGSTCCCREHAEKARDILVSVGRTRQQRLFRLLPGARDPHRISRHHGGTAHGTLLDERGETRERGKRSRGLSFGFSCAARFSAREKSRETENGEFGKALHERAFGSNEPSRVPPRELLVIILFRGCTRFPRFDSPNARSCKCSAMRASMVYNCCVYKFCIILHHEALFSARKRNLSFKSTGTRRDC